MVSISFRRGIQSPATIGWLRPFHNFGRYLGGKELIQVLEHANKEKYPGQLLYEVDVNGYVHVVPVVRQGRTLLLKTIYPSRKATGKRPKGESQ